MLSAIVACGQEFPSKPIRILTSAPGSSTDFAARFIGQGISPGLEQNVIVENRPSNILGEIVAKAPPDGYTLLLGGGTFLMGPLLQKMPYDPVADFVAVTLAATSPNILVVHPSLPVKSARELIALAKSRPGALNFGSAASGSATHLAGALFKAMAGINIVWVPYTGAGPAVVALVGGEVQMAFNSPIEVISHIKAGKLRALAVTSAQPSALVSWLPTVAATGLPGYESVAILGIFAPVKTPEAIVNRLNQEIVRFVRSADAKKKFFDTGVETVGSSPAEFAARIKSDIAKTSKVIKDSGIRVE
jgi:tripartite-type tricarboxylate transporter receptor subunit TctC